MSSMHKVIIYLKMSAKALVGQPSLNTVQGIVKFFPSWVKHLVPGKNSLTDAQPWLSFGAIEFLKSILSANMNVFEYGSGGSTLFLAARAKQVISVEHDKQWFTNMKTELSKRGIDNIEYLYVPSESDSQFNKKYFGNPDDYISSDILYKGENFESYVKIIDRYPENFFDLVIVDGRARPSCIKHALPAIKAGGYLVVDNSERKYYLDKFRLDKTKWEKRVFNGAVPYNLHFSETTILRKR